MTNCIQHRLENNRRKLKELAAGVRNKRASSTNFKIELSDKKVFQEYLRGGPIVLVQQGLLWILCYKKVLVVLKKPLDLVPISSVYRSRYSIWLRQMKLL